MEHETGKLMNKMAADWTAFNDKVAGYPIPAAPELLSVPRANFRTDFMQEELDEFMKANREGDLDGAVDACIDLMYVTMGALGEMGVLIQPTWAEVQQANMRKPRGERAKRPGAQGFDAVKPEGWTIPADVTAVHGITNERAMDEGVPERDLLEEFLALTGPSIYRVAYNERFDARMIRIALHRFGDPERVAAWEIHPKPRCAMTPMINIVNLPPTKLMVRSGRTFAKTPKLVESYEFMFREMMEDAHDALADTRATKRLWFEMLARGIVV